jgi:histidinol-phosphatase
MYRGELLLGVSHAHSYGESAWARRGGGAFIDGAVVRTAQTSELRDAVLSTGNLKRLAAGRGWTELGAMIGEVNRIRGYGDFLHYHMLASAQLDLVIESDVNILDIAPSVVILREAGGCFTDLNGAEPGLHTRSVLAAATSQLHARVLPRFSGVLT